MLLILFILAQAFYKKPVPYRSGAVRTIGGGGRRSMRNDQRAAGGKGVPR
jgi:hypothetical protein